MIAVIIPTGNVVTFSCRLGESVGQSCNSLPGILIIVIGEVNRVEIDDLSRFGTGKGLTCGCSVCELAERNASLGGKSRRNSCSRSGLIEDVDRGNGIIVISDLIGFNLSY